MAKAPPEPSFQRRQIFSCYQAFKDELSAIAATADAAARHERLDALWSSLVAAGQVPYAQGNRYAMLYRGPAKSVAFWKSATVSPESTASPAS